MSAATSRALLLSSGQGPVECQLALSHVLARMQREASQYAVDLSVSAQRSKHGLKSAVVYVDGEAAAEFCSRWLGSILWRCPSQLRPGHKRANWYVAVFALPISDLPSSAEICPGDLRYSSFRAGGPGGQHQNTTDSAIRVEHLPTGLSALAREERSQHRNKSLALQRLQALFVAQTLADEQQRKHGQHALHQALQRGNAVRCFSGVDFKE